MLYQSIIVEIELSLCFGEESHFRFKEGIKDDVTVGERNGEPVRKITLFLLFSKPINKM